MNVPVLGLREYHFGANGAGSHLMIPQCLLSAAACCRVDVHCNALPLNSAMLQKQRYRADYVPTATANLHTPVKVINLNVLRCGSPFAAIRGVRELIWKQKARF